MRRASERGAAPDRIAIVTTSYPDAEGDPAGHFVATEACALAAEGHEVIVVTSGSSPNTDGNPRVIRLASGGATGFPGIVPRLRERPLRVLGLVSWSAAARATLRREGPFDRVIAHWLAPSGFPIAFRAVRKARLEIVVHGSDARALARLPRPIRHAFFAAIERDGTELRCVSEELSALIRRLDRGASRLRVRVAQAPVAIETAADREHARRALGIASTRRLAVVVARLIASKRVDEALSAAGLLPELDVVVVGDGPERAALGVKFPRARFVGFLSRERALLWMAAADVVISASRLEGAPTVVREARALGTPVVAVNAGDLARWAEGDPALFVVD